VHTRRAWRSSTRASPSPRPLAVDRDGAARRHVRRVRSLAFQRAIAQLPRVDDRMLVLLWALAERWGRVSPDGVRVPVGLPHRMLATLVGARRPSVTTALTGWRARARRAHRRRLAAARRPDEVLARRLQGADEAMSRLARATLEAGANAAGDVRRALGDAEARLPGRPRRQRGWVERAVARGALGEGGRDRVELAPRRGALDAGALDERLDGRLGVVDRLLVAAAQAPGTVAATSARIVVERLAAHAQDELG
jgi:hypothetical protein